MTFVKSALQNGGILRPLIIPSELTNGTGLYNSFVLIKNDSFTISFLLISTS